MKSRQILDPVHGYVEVPAALDGLVDSPAVQRLRRISQTALASMVYPGANGTRFEHALGAMHLARLAFIHAWENSTPDTVNLLRGHIGHDVPHVLPQDMSNVRDSIANAVAAVGLLHDIGHPPFSHALEDYFRTFSASIFADTPSFIETLNENQARPFHELAGESIVGTLVERFPNRPSFKLFHTIYLADPDGQGWASALHAIVASTIDIDRIDYVMRDSMHAGTEYGAIDRSRLISSMEFRQDESGQVRLALGLRARSAAELLLVQRMQAFRWMYQHPRVVAVEALLRESLHELQLVKTISPQSEHDRWIADAVRKLSPPLNYVRQSSTYRISGLSVDEASMTDPESDGSSMQIPLPFEINVPAENLNEERSRSIFSEIQMSVTDDAIRSYASASAVCCRAAIDRGAQHPSIGRYLHYYDGSLRRSSALVVLWKRYEEYVAMAETVLASDVAQKFSLQLMEAIDGAATGLSAATSEQFRQNTRRILNDPLTFLNYLGYALLHRGSTAAEFSAMLTQEYSEVAGGVQGIWQCAFLAQKNPLHSLSPNILLEGSAVEPVSLAQTSPLVASIAEVERRSVKFHAFFLVTSRSGTVDLPRHELRSRLREVFGRALPLFLRSHMDSSLIGAKASLMHLAEVDQHLDSMGN